MTAATATQIKAGTWAIDPVHSSIAFSVRHLLVSKVRGHFNTFSGAVVVGEDGAPSVTAEIAIDSVDTRNEQRDAHLRSNDFLAMEEYPEITFTSTGIQQTGPTSVELTGDLTVRGVTNTVTIPFEFEGAATDPYGNLRVGFEGSVVINRKDYGVTWNVALETGGVLVSDKVTLEFEVSAIKAA